MSGCSGGGGTELYIRCLWVAVTAQRAVRAAWRQVTAGDTPQEVGVRPSQWQPAAHPAHCHTAFFSRLLSAWQRSARHALAGASQPSPPRVKQFWPERRVFLVFSLLCCGRAAGVFFSSVVSGKSPKSDHLLTFHGFTCCACLQLQATQFLLSRLIQLHFLQMSPMLNGGVCIK